MNTLAFRATDPSLIVNKGRRSHNINELFWIRVFDKDSTPVSQWNFITVVQFKTKFFSSRLLHILNFIRYLPSRAYLP